MLITDVPNHFKVEAPLLKAAHYGATTNWVGLSPQQIEWWPQTSLVSCTPSSSMLGGFGVAPWRRELGQEKYSPAACVTLFRRDSLWIDDPEHIQHQVEIGGRRVYICILVQVVDTGFSTSLTLQLLISLGGVSGVLHSKETWSMSVLCCIQWRAVVGCPALRRSTHFQLASVPFSHRYLSPYIQARKHSRRCCAASGSF